MTGDLSLRSGAIADTQSMATIDVRDLKGLQRSNGVIRRRRPDSIARC